MIFQWNSMTVPRRVIQCWNYVLWSQIIFVSVPVEAVVWFACPSREAYSYSDRRSNFVWYCHVNNSYCDYAVFHRERLLIDPKEHPMLLAEPSCNTPQQRERWSGSLPSIIRMWLRFVISVFYVKVLDMNHWNLFI